jgi:hypothetical protein
MDGFFCACDLSNVCGVIDGSHISFFPQKLDQCVSVISIDYYCK